MSGEDLREAERLGPAPPVPEPGRVRSLVGLATIDVGPLRRHRDFRLLFAGQGLSFFGSMITFVALPYQTYQLCMPLALFPAFAEEFGGAGVLGLLYAAPSVGALVATVTSGWTGRVNRHGIAVVWAAAGWGAAIAALGFAPNLALALVALGLAGAADMISGIFRSAIWNTTVPDHLRGRLAGIEQVSYSSGPMLGNLEAGVVAAITSVRVSIVSGGLLCIAGVAVAALALPGFRRYDARNTSGEPVVARQ